MATMLVNAYKLQSTPNHNDQVRFEDLKGHWGEKYANILIDLKSLMVPRTVGNQIDL